MMVNHRRSASNLTFCLFNVNSFKDNSDDRTSELSSLFKETNAQLYIITETKLNSNSVAKFNQTLSGETVETQYNYGN